MPTVHVEITIIEFGLHQLQFISWINGPHVHSGDCNYRIWAGPYAASLYGAKRWLDAGIWIIFADSPLE
jgi:hypothetical protein